MPISPENRILRDAKKLVGLQIAGVRYMTEEERAALYIDNRGVVLLLSDGTTLYPMADDEGNDAGTLVVQAADGHETVLPRLDRSRARPRSPA
jgi:hypothetical protein